MSKKKTTRKKRGSDVETTITVGGHTAPLDEVIERLEKKTKVAAGKDAGKVVRRFTELLPVVLTDAEIQDRGEQLAAAEKRLVDHNTEAKRIKADLSDTEKGIRSEINHLAASINAKTEQRTIEVEVRKLSERMVEEVRLDTGERVRERPADDDEFQGGLFGEVVIGPSGAARAGTASDSDDEDNRGSDEEE